MGKHSIAQGRGRRNPVGPIATAGLASVALAGAGVMLLLGPDSPTMRSVSADVRLVNTEGPSSDGNSDAGETRGTTGTTGNNTKAKKPHRPDVKQVQERLREHAAEATKVFNDRAAEAKKTVDDIAEGVGLKRAAGNDNNDTRSPLRRPKLPASSKADSNDGPSPTTATEPKQQWKRTSENVLSDNPIPHRINDVAQRVTAALPGPVINDRQPDSGAITALISDPSPDPAPRQAFVAPPPAPAPAPISPITGLLSAVTLGTIMTPNAPTEPADMPGVWAVMAWARRQSAYTVDNNTAAARNTLVAPTLNSAVLDPTEIVNRWIYQPVHYGAQLWITSPLGSAVGNTINQISGQYLIGNGADGTEANPDGGDGGAWIGDGGDGYDGAATGQAGGDGGDAGWFGNGGEGGDGWAGMDGGDGGDGGSFMGIGGDGGNGGASFGGQPAGNGGHGGDANGWFFGIAGDGGRGGNGITGTSGAAGDWNVDYGNGYGNGQDGGVGGGNGGNGGDGGDATGFVFATGGNGGDGGDGGTGGVGGVGANGDATHLSG
ncbi:PGRS repeat-containing protein, partial [Mycolicibacterium fortuitum]